MTYKENPKTKGVKKGKVKTVKVFKIREDKREIIKRILDMGKDND